ncbi:MAG: sulfurtransferase TusA family protein [Deltaproteobacteria bacterium]|nr:MAG: sulfurtransferase TusA family protein [Deltaproteobacteria bacterium]RLF57138.1 MAG: sulfurtransferase TusA family protein [Thermoplasmata archaeon]
MPKRSRIDLSGVVSPICLLQCKRALGERNRGDTLEILLRDPEVVDDLVKIINHSPDQLISKDRKEECYRIVVRKG